MSRTPAALAVAVAAALLAWQFTAGAQAALSSAAAADRVVTFRLIVVSSESAAREVAERLRRGADGDAIAAAESIDPSAARGGLIGPVVLAELRAELRDALSSLTLGATSGVVRLPTGFGVVQLVEPRANRPRLRSTEIGGIAATGVGSPGTELEFAL